MCSSSFTTGNDTLDQGLNVTNKVFTGGTGSRVGGARRSAESKYDRAVDKAKRLKLQANKPRLAIGTQTGGTRKPLGSSSSGLNR